MVQLFQHEDGYTQREFENVYSQIVVTVSGVSSVFGRAGAVVATSNDYTWNQIDKSASDIADITTRSHTDLTDIGTNTHAQIDTHIAAGSSLPDFEAYLPAGSWTLPSTNYAPPDTLVLTNGTIYVHLFDDGGTEYLESVFVVPSDIDASGTVTIETYGMAITAAASKNVEFTFYHSAKADGEDIDAAYSTEVSGDLATDSTQDNLDRFTFTETVSNLGWAANDNVRIKLGRTPASANELSGDYGLISGKIIIPRA